MAPRMRKGCIIFIICVSCALLQTVSTQAVTDTDCDPNADGAAVCAGVDANAVCPNDGTKCECKSGYQQDKTDNTKCAKVLGGTCMAVDDCTVANSECITSTCSCMAGYKEVNDICKKAVTDTDCDPNADGAAVCAGADANAECPNDGMKCECKSGYQQDKIDDTTCAKVLTGSCSINDECTGTVANSECSETTCSCIAGYKEANDICEKVLGGECTTGADCPVTNSECSGTTCSCVAGYKEVNDICEKVLTESCTVDVDCTDTVDNSECSSSTCSCVAGYREVDNICEIVLTGPCEADSECTSSVVNSECSSETCSCVAGYKAVDNLCEKVLGGSCSVAADCSISVQNSTCLGNKCSCIENHIEDEDICKKAVGEDCTNDEECVIHAECDTTCQCTLNYVDNNGSCVVPSLAPSTWTTTGLLVTSLFVYLPKLLNFI